MKAADNDAKLKRYNITNYLYDNVVWSCDLFLTNSFFVMSNCLVTAIFFLSRVFTSSCSIDIEIFFLEQEIVLKSPRRYRNITRQGFFTCSHFIDIVILFAKGFYKESPMQTKQLLSNSYFVTLVMNLVNNSEKSMLRRLLQWLCASFPSLKP